MAMTTNGWSFVIKQADDINLFIIKALGATLTMITLCGYIFAVSKIESYLNGHIMALAVILLAITILGYLVFHVKVRTDSSSDATLFNLFSTILAFTSEARSCLLVLLISNELYSWLHQTIPTMILFLMLLITLIAVFNIVGVTCCSVIKQLSPTLYLRMSQSWISAKIILAVEIISSVLTIVTVVLGCDGDLPCVETFLSNSMMNLALASFGILMIMTDCALQYRKGLNKIGFLFKNNSTSQRGSEASSVIASQV